MPHPAGGVEHRRQTKTDVKTVELVPGQARRLDEGLDAGKLAVRQRFEAVARQDPVFTPKVYDVGDGSHRRQARRAKHKFPQSRFEPSARTEFIRKGPGQLKGDHRAGRILVRIGLFQRRMNDGRGFGQSLIRLVVIGDNQIETQLARKLGGVKRRNAAIDSHQELAAGLGQSFNRLEVQAVTLVDAVRDVIVHVGAEQSEHLPEDGDAGNAVHVVVAIQGDFFLVLNGLFQSLNRRSDSRHFVWIDQVG